MVRRLVLESDEAIAEVKRSHSSSALERARARVQELMSASSEMHSSWQSKHTHDTARARVVLRRKVEQLQQEAERVQAEFAKAERSFAAGSASSERHSFIGKQSTSTTRAHGKNALDIEAQALESSQRSLANAENLYEQGAQILATLAQQRDRMKSAQRKALDVMHTAKLSESIARAIEQRQSTERRIAYAGMLLVTLVTIAVLWWRTSR